MTRFYCPQCDLIFVGEHECPNRIAAPVTSPDNVVPIRDNLSDTLPVGAVCAATVEVLERWLADAKRGELHAVGLAGVRPNRTVTSEWTGSVNANDLTAAILTLHTRSVSAFMQSIEYPDG